MRKSFALLLAATAIIGLTLGVANAAAPVVGKKCSKAGLSAKVAGDRFTCTKSGKKLIWKKVIPAVVKAVPSPSPTQTMDPAPIIVAPSAPPEPTQTPKPSIFANQSALTRFISLAQAARANATNKLPILDTSGAVTINQVAGQGLPLFVKASTTDRFTFLGPTPLVETDPTRTGAVSQITKDHRMVYQARDDLPPWAVAFTISTTDSLGRFVVETSGMNGSRLPQYSWRLVYKTSTGPWMYQSIAGLSRPNDDAHHFDEVSLGAPGSFSIRLEFEATTSFYGIGLSDVTSTISTLTSNASPRVAILGDSWVSPEFNETGPVHVWDAFTGALTWITGWNVISAGVAGQGYLQPARGGTETYKDRVVRDLVPQNPDVIIFTGSPNDPWGPGKFTDEQIAAEMGRDIKLVQEANPDILIIVCSPFQTDPHQASLMRKEAASLGVSIIDFATPALFDENNNAQRQLVDGHPTRLGSAYIANEMLKRIAGLKSK
ncbi:MAG: hypothetical protein F2638_01065 [Actinobacteria bacterium]|nr:hypothetical protein [Actinomycetota bacterium]